MIFLPIINKLRQLVGMNVSLAEAACDATLIQADEMQSWDKIHFLDGQLEKVKGSAPGVGLDQEIATARATEVRHLPVVRFILNNVTVHSSGFSFNGGNFLTRPYRPAKLFSRPTKVASALYCMSPVSEQYFGHWLQDACATALLRESEEELLIHSRPDWPNTAEYIAALGISPSSASPKLVERLTVYQDFSQGSNKQMRYAQMRERLATFYGEPSSDLPFVYLRRGSTGAARVISNEQEMIGCLEKIGFVTVDVAGASVQTIYCWVRRARIVISVDGSHLNHLYFMMPRRSGLITLIPDDRFTMTQRGYAQAAGLRYGFIVMDGDGTAYHAEISDLLRTLELMNITSG